MNDGTLFGNPQSDAAEQAKRAADRLWNKIETPGGNSSGLNPLELLRQQTLGKPSPWGGDVPPAFPPAGTDRPQFPPAGTDRPQFPPAGTDRPQFPPAGTDRPQFPPAGTDRQPDVPQGFPVTDGVMRISYGDPNFDAALAQTNYSKVVITGVPKEFTPSPWVDEQGKGYFFWFKNPKNPDYSDRAKHYFPQNLKQIEIAQYQGNIYKPVLISADEMRIAASQAYMKQQNEAGYGSYKSTTDAFTYAANMAKITGPALQYEEALMREGAKNSPANPYFHIYLADVLTAEAIQPVIQAIASGKQAYFDNPYTNAKLDEAIRESQIAGQITRQYGNLVKPPSYEMPLSPFGLNPYSYNPDYYWCGAAYQSAVREMQLTFLKRTVVMGGKLPIELPPALPPKP